MLEVGARPTLCRNGEFLHLEKKSDTAVKKPPEQEQSDFCPRPFAHHRRAEGIFMGRGLEALVLDQAANGVETLPIATDELARRRSANQYKGHVALERLKAYDDATTQFAELVDGSMRTEFELTLIDDDLYGRDGRSMGEVTEKALTDAKEAAKKNPALWFEVGRRSTEREEYLEMLAMAKGEGPNTMIVTSDFPHALKEAKKDVGGYNVTRQQAMERAITRPKVGILRMHSQTLDGSDRKALEAIDEEFGFKTHDGELLGQRRRFDLSADEQAVIMDRIVGVYDKRMSTQHGGEWYAGRRPADYRNTYEFVCQQRDLLDACVDLMLTNKLTKNMMYDMAATMQARFEKNKTTKIEPIQNTDMSSIINAEFISWAARTFTNQGALYQEIQMAGQSARKAGKSFSACGSTLTSEGEDSSVESQLEAAGYGSKTNMLEKYGAGSDRYGSRKFKCSNGHSNIRPHNKLIDKCQHAGCEAKVKC